MYGHTIDASPQYDSQEAARVDACRAALEVLKAEYPEWTVPSDPLESRIPRDWDWVQLLRGRKSIRRSSTANVSRLLRAERNPRSQVHQTEQCPTYPRPTGESVLRYVWDVQQRLGLTERLRTYGNVLHAGTRKWYDHNISASDFEEFERADACTNPKGAGRCH
jgi:hypothetical protein